MRDREAWDRLLDCYWEVLVKTSHMGNTMPRTIWFVTLDGEGVTNHYFIEGGSKDEMKKVLCRGIINGKDAPESDEDREQMEMWMNDIGDSDNWSNREYESDIGETGRIRIIVIDAQALAPIISRIVESWSARG